MTTTITTTLGFFGYLQGFAAEGATHLTLATWEGSILLAILCGAFALDVIFGLITLAR